jgi:anti-sigma B factor antagonist
MFMRVCVTTYGRTSWSSIWLETSKQHLAYANSWPEEDEVDLDIRQSGNICCLKLKGPLKNGEGIDELDKAVEAALSSGHIHLLLDLSATPYIDSSGIGAVVDALREAKKVGGDAKLVSPSPFAAKTFKMVGVLTLFKVYDSEAAAVEACLG